MCVGGGGGGGVYHCTDTDTSLPCDYCNCDNVVIITITIKHRQDHHQTLFLYTPHWTLNPTLAVRQELRGSAVFLLLDIV